MKKMLMLTSVASMIDQFFVPHIELLLRMGYKVDVACNFKTGSTCSDDVILRLKERLTSMNVEYYHIDFDRSITNLKGNCIAYNQVKKLIISKGYSFIHCHSPIGGVIGRLAAKATGTRVLYTAHGFHFHRKSPRKNWLIYYPIEKILSNITHGLITINTEDYNLAKTKMKAKDIYYVPGVGIDIDRACDCSTNRTQIKKRYNIPEDAILMVSVGELNENKNHQVIIKAIAETGRDDVHFIICGNGPLKNELTELAKDLKIDKQIHIPGFCDDIPEINSASDIFCFPSLREGLGVAALEGMAAGLPLITSDVHGINDYNEYGKTGFKYSPQDVAGFADGINKLSEDESLRRKMGECAREKVKEFELEIVIKRLEEIYSREAMR